MATRSVISNNPRTHRSDDKPEHWGVPLTSIVIRYATIRVDGRSIRHRAFFSRLRNLHPHPHAHLLRPHANNNLLHNVLPRNVCDLPDRWPAKSSASREARRQTIKRLPGPRRRATNGRINPWWILLRSHINRHEKPPRIHRFQDTKVSRG